MQPFQPTDSPSSESDHGLGAGLGQVDDLQATVTERDPALDQTPAESGPRGAIASAMAADRGDVRCLAVETHLAGGSTHPLDPTGWPPTVVGAHGARLLARRPPVASPVSSTCLIGPVNQFFTDACQ